MKLIIVRIEKDVVTCELDDGGIIDIGRQWLPKDIKTGQTIEFEYNNKT